MNSVEPVTVQGCELCKIRPAREGGRLCEQCMGLSAIARDLPTCPHCYEPVKPEDLHPIRKGLHVRCVSESMREAKRAKKAQKQARPESVDDCDATICAENNAMLEAKEQRQEPTPILKTCTECGEHFAPYKHGVTNPNVCPSCIREKGRSGIRSNWLSKFRNEGMLIIDLNVLADLLPKIEQDATACLRTVEAQCLWYILEMARKL